MFYTFFWDALYFDTFQTDGHPKFQLAEGGLAQSMNLIKLR